jgi:hypothetical protein
MWFDPIYKIFLYICFMESLTPQNRLIDIIFKYLDMKLDGIEKRRGKGGDIIFVFPDKKYGVLGLINPGTLIISRVISEEIQNMFGLRLTDTVNLIGMYVVNRYNLEVTHTLESMQYSVYLCIDRYNLN